MSDEKRREQYRFWQHRWTQEHTSQILVCVVSLTGLLILALCRRIGWLAGACVAIIPLVRVVFYHQMMLYVERRIYDEAESGQEKENI